MKIGIIGAGNVGATLGSRWHKAGRDIVFGVREPNDLKHDRLKRLGMGVDSVERAAQSADVVVIATPWEATQRAIETCGDLTAKVLVDCTNPLRPALAGLTHGLDDSGAEQVARWAKSSNVVKAFNTTGSNIMENPRLGDRAATMFICGADGAKGVVRELSDQLGFETVDAGPLENARLLEPMALLWIRSAYQLGVGREFALCLLRR